jgi:KaiC/GvpD/RAD55 family RecA-like ATPase
MLRNAVEGLENVIETEIPKGSIILIAGTPGCLKSTFTHDLFSNYLQDKKDEFGLYVTLEETIESHLRNMNSIGIKIPKNLFISDHSEIRKNFESETFMNFDYMDMISALIEHFKEEKGEKFTCFALDSLSALYSLVKLNSFEELRIKLYHFFKELRTHDLTSILIMEMPEFGIIPEYEFSGSESFLVDGLIVTGEVETKQDVLIYLQVKKLRAAIHSRKKHLLEVGEGGLSILGPIFV